MDYREPILRTLSDAAAKADVFQAQAANTALAAIGKYASQGPIDAETAFGLMGLLPIAVASSFPPITVTTSGSGPAPTGLAPNVGQGFQSWYWNATQFANPDTAVVLVLKQVQVNPSMDASAWALYGGATHPVTREWINIPSTYLDSDQVRIDAAGATIVGRSDVQATFAAAPNGFSISCSTPQLQFSVTATSARGPTYEQAGGNVLASGPFQNGYWSIVDGSVTAGSVTVQGTPPFTFSTGWSWLDYEQFAVKPLPGVLSFFSSVKPAPPQFTMNWMWLMVQSPGMQLDMFIVGTAVLEKLHRGGTVQVTNVSVWVPGRPAQHNQRAAVKIDAVYPGTNIPRGVTITVDGTATFALASYSRGGLPSVQRYVGGTAYESPCLVQSQPAARGMIEWVVPADARDAAKTLGLPSTYIPDLTKPSTAAVLVIVGLVLMVLFVAAIITTGVYSAKVIQA